MKQAKVLIDKELNKVLDVISLYAHAERNRAMVLLTHLCDLRVCELANLRVSDVVNENGEIRDLLYFDATQTKGIEVRRVFVANEQSQHLNATYKAIQASYSVLFCSTRKRVSDSTQTHLRN